ncbi:MAG: hypothetical protein R2710_30270 [Acidimicrobiales bacterium]
MITSLANHGFRATRALAVALLILAGVVFGIGSSPAPVGAELASLPTTTWGVSGLQTGTETDNIDAPIFDMARIGNVLYVGGRFTDVTDGVTTVAQSSLAAFDATTGEWIPTFTPSFDLGAVYALEASPDGSRLFVGGDFTTVNGTGTGALIAADPATGAVDTGWSGRVGGYQLVRDFDIDGTQLCGRWLHLDLELGRQRGQPHRSLRPHHRRPRSVVATGAQQRLGVGHRRLSVGRSGVCRRHDQDGQRFAHRRRLH